MDETCSATTTVTLEQVPAQAGGTFPIDGGAAAAQGSYAQTGMDVLPLVIALAAIAVLGIVAALIARRKRAFAATVGVLAVAAACMLPLPAFADISVTVPLQTQATIAADGTVTIEDGQMRNTGDETLVLKSVALDAPAGVSGTWTLQSGGSMLFSGGVGATQSTDMRVEAGTPAPLSWSTTFGGKEAGALVDGRIATATYTVAPLPALQGTVTFEDAPKTDVPLKAVVEELSDGATPHYTWYVDGKVVLEGPGEDSYTPSSDDGGKEIWVVVTDENGNYSGSLSSDKEAVLKKMTGTASLGTSYVGVASAATVSGTPSDATLSYAFYVGGTSVQSGTSKSYTPKVADNGKKLKVVVTDTSGKYYGSISSAEVTIAKRALSGKVTISGTLQPGQKLTASASGFPSDAKLAYTWYVDGTSKGTGTTYTLASADAGKQVWVSASDTSGIYSGSVTSSKVTVLEPLEGMISVSGVPKGGSTLTANSSGVSPGASLTYTWHIDDNAVATGSSYIVRPSDEGKQLWITATDTNGKFFGTLISDKVSIAEDVYATFYSNGDMIFTVGVPTAEQANGRGDEISQYGNFIDRSFSIEAPWKNELYAATSVTVLESISPKSMDHWFDGGYDSTAIKSVNLGSIDSSSTLGTVSLFGSCTKLTTLILPDDFGQNVSSADMMFSDCESLTSVSLPEGFGKSLYSAVQMFRKCSSLETIRLPEGFGQSCYDGNIGLQCREMFYGCTKLKSIVFPESFFSDSNYGLDMFKNCDSLQKITFGSGFAAAFALPSTTWYDYSTGEQFAQREMNKRAGTYVNDPALLPEGVEPSSMSLMSAEDEGAEVDAGADAGDGVDGADEASGAAGTGMNDVEGAVAEESDAAVESAAGPDEAALDEDSDGAESDGAAGGADASVGQVIALAALDVPQISETLPIIGTDEAAAGGDALSGADGGSPVPYPSDELRFAA